MAHQVKVDCTITVDGVVQKRLVKTVSVDESLPYTRVEKADDNGTYSSFNANQDMDELNVVVVETDQQMTVRLDGQSDAGIVLNAGGFLVICDADIDASASTNLTVSNDSGSTANVGLLAAGT